MESKPQMGAESALWPTPHTARAIPLMSAERRESPSGPNGERTQRTHAAGPS